MKKTRFKYMFKNAQGNNVAVFGMGRVYFSDMISNNFKAYLESLIGKDFEYTMKKGKDFVRIPIQDYDFSYREFELMF